MPSHQSTNPTGRLGALPARAAAPAIFVIAMRLPVLTTHALLARHFVGPKALGEPGPWLAGLSLAASARRRSLRLGLIDAPARALP